MKNSISIPKQHFRVRLLATACALAVSASYANAQPESIENIDVFGKKLQGLNLEDVNSASNRLGLSAMDLAGSVEFIDAEVIDIRGDFSAISALTRATGFSASASPGNGGTATSVRGFNGHGSVAYTYDGVRLYVGAGTVTFPADTWTVERVDILRGAGSVINGIGAIGATVNYVSKQPKFEAISSEVAVTAGSENLLRLAFGSSGQLTEKTAYRFDAVNHETDGYVDNGDERRTALSAALLHNASEDLGIKFSVDYAETDQSPYWGTPLVGENQDELNNSIRDNNYNVEDGLVEYEDLWPRVNIQWQLSDGISFRNDTFYMKADRHWRNVESYDFDSTTGLVDRSFFLEILHEQRQWGTRSDVLFDLDTAGFHSHLSVGAETNVIEFTHFNNRPYGGGDRVDINAPVAGFWADSVANTTSKDFDSDTTQYAVFADYHLELSDAFSVISGIRYDSIDFEREDFERSNGLRNDGTAHFEEAKDTNDDYSGTSWRLGTVFQPIESLSLYAQYSQALDSIQSILSATKTDLELGEGEQFEVGLKQTLWNERLQYTVALFDIEKTNLLRTNPGGVQEQIGKQTSQGVEFDVNVQLTDSVNVDANLAYVDAEVNDDLRPRNVPEKTANLWVQWNATNDWLLEGGVRYVGERYANNSNTSELPSYSSYDAGVHWQYSDDVRLSLRGKNLSNEDDFVLAPYGNQWILAQGRNVELSVNYQF